MKEIAPYTKLEPRQRAEENASFIKKFNEDPNNEIIKIKGQRNVSGVVLNPVKIVLGDGKTETQGG